MKKTISIILMIIFLATSVSVVNASGKIGFFENGTEKCIEITSKKAIKGKDYKKETKKTNNAMIVKTIKKKIKTKGNATRNYKFSIKRNPCITYDVKKKQISTNKHRKRTISSKSSSCSYSAIVPKIKGYKKQNSYHTNLKRKHTRNQSMKTVTVNRPYKKAVLHERKVTTKRTQEPRIKFTHLSKNKIIVRYIIDDIHTDITTIKEVTKKSSRYKIRTTTTEETWRSGSSIVYTYYRTSF